MGRPLGSKNKDSEEDQSMQSMSEEKKTLVPDEDGKIKIDKTKLDQILDQLDEQKKQISRLEYAASKSGLGKYDDAHKAERGKVGKLRTWVTEEGKELAIISWKDLLKDIVEKDGNGRWHEEQMICIKTEDGMDREMRYDLFTRRHKYVSVDVLDKTPCATPKDGIWRFKVKVTAKDSQLFGNEYEINDTFFN
jgi:hypothetical protein